MIPKLKKNSGQLTPPLGVIYLLLLRAMYNLCTKFEMSINPLQRYDGSQI